MQLKGRFELTPIRAGLFHTARRLLSKSQRYYLEPEQRCVFKGREQVSRGRILCSSVLRIGKYWRTLLKLKRGPLLAMEPTNREEALARASWCAKNLLVYYQPESHSFLTRLPKLDNVECTTDFKRLEIDEEQFFLPFEFKTKNGTGHAELTALRAERFCVYDGVGGSKHFCDFSGLTGIHSKISMSQLLVKFRCGPRALLTLRQNLADHTPRDPAARIREFMKLEKKCQLDPGPLPKALKEDLLRRTDRA